MFIVDNVGGGQVSVDHGDNKYVVLTCMETIALGISRGKWRVVQVEAGANGLWVRRGSSGLKAYIYKRHPEVAMPGDLVKSFCWDRFSAATGVQLGPGGVGKFAPLKEAA